ncbi:hypothetical protein N8I77_005726 [Diaporthe amygdali]|uniref:Amidoligase enzyme n=1 Tax=Phomopsis amygdali TaxID=1214568 RepID=A0AAD9W3P1_PHOAM|nr:hypothetical protein N8I77_005726 [Diaporthe amygdali]
MATSGFRLGIEVEALLIPYDQKVLPVGKGLAEFATLITKSYNSLRDPKKNYAMRADIGRKYQGVEYQDWVLTNDITLKGDEKMMYMVEIVSPILKAEPYKGGWRSEINDMFKYLNTLCAVRSNRSCSFHVHLSPIGSSWSLKELQGISIAVIHFECAFEALIPETRRGNQFIRSNRFFGNALLEDLQHSECIKQIQLQKTVKDLAGLMSADRYTTWNFENLKEDYRKGTIEFRQPPGQTHATGCLSWIELAIDFVQSARRKDWHAKVKDYPQNVSGLRRFISEGLVDGLSRECFLGPLLNSKEGSAKFVPKAPDYDTTLMAKKEKEDKKKNILMEKLKENLKKELKNPQSK